MALGNVDDGLCSILATYQMNQGFARITFVRHDVLGMELTACCEAGLTEYVRCTSCVMDIASTNMSGNGKFIFRVYKQVELVAQRELGLAVRVLLNRPSSLRVRRVGLPPIDPALNSSRVQGYPLTKPWQGSVMLSYQAAGYILQLRQNFSPCQPCKEARKGRVVGYTIRRVNPARLSDEGVVPQLPPKCFRRRKTQGVFGYKALPEHSYGMPLGATPNGVNNGRNQRSVIQPFKESLKLCNDGWRLRRCASGDNIGQGHGKMHLPVRLGVVGVSAPAAPLYISTSVLKPS